MFRPAWIEAETFGGARMPVVGTADMQRFADHVTGFLKDERAVVGLFQALFAVGAQVMVTDGPFASFPGVVEAFDADQGVYKVAVSVFGRKTPVELEEAHVEAA
jgi:transcription termination/antitermination protein NusG